ncbi:MAG: xanthine dehydrogenase family protein molybdopterin-binding subunit [Gemmatimonadota bacterium]
MAEAPQPPSSVGTNVRRSDGLAKASGRALYIDDLTFPGMLHGRTIRSTIGVGSIRDIRLDLGADGFTVVDHTHIPGANVIRLIDDDQPCLAPGVVRHQAEPILLLAHEDRELLWQVRVEIDYEPHEAVLDYETSQRTQTTLEIDKGDVETALAGAEVVVEGTYRTGHQEQLYIETNGVIAVPEAGGVTIYGSLQCPYYVHKALRVLLDLPGERIRVVQTETGGGFGGKEEYPSMIAGHAALLALEAGRPVKLIYDREEDLQATTKRHPFTIRHRTGLTREGVLVAQDIDVLSDAGAYVTLSPVVLSRGVIHAAGPYRCPNVRIRGRSVMTNTPPNGAFRGFGAPQTIFAGEVHMERVAEHMGMDSVELRELNALRPGDETATGGTVGPDGSALEALHEALERTDYRNKRAAYAAAAGAGGPRRGIGLALYHHGAGFTGSGEVTLASEAALETTEVGVRVLSSTVEIGQGARTSHAQIVADTLGIPFERVEVAQPDTAYVPDSGPTVASRTCMVVGGILRDCAQEMLELLEGVDPSAHHRSRGPLRVQRGYRAPPGLVWDEGTYEGDAYGTYGWACDVAEVELDPDTWEVRPLRVTAVCEIGKAIHPRIVLGQIEGATAQGVGYALLEEVVMRDGLMANAQLTNYIIPTTLDTPPIDAVILESPYRHGPFGAKGVGELPIDGPAPALVNALRHLRLDVREIPATPERLMDAPSLEAGAAAERGAALDPAAHAGDEAGEAA